VRSTPDNEPYVTLAAWRVDSGAELGIVVGVILLAFLLMIWQPWND
jgi:hypothetical protein